jgi:dienelactone hydrolase
MRRLLPLLLICVAMAARADWRPETVQFPSLSYPGVPGPTPIIPATIHKPSGTGPFPAIVLLHSCGGINAELRAQTYVLGDRIGLLGFSHGGGTITALVTNTPLSKPFRAAVAYYPHCADNFPPLNAPTLILIGANDDWTPAPPCSDWASRVANSNRLNVVVYPNVRHGFAFMRSTQEPGADRKMHRVVGDPAAADASARANAFFAHWLR